MGSHRLWYILIVSVLLSSLSGCAAFRSGETQPLAPWPISTEQGKQTISLLVTGESSVNGTRQDVPQRMIDVWQAVTEKAYKDSGYFSDIKIGAAETDLRAEIHFTDRGEANSALAFLSGFTMTLIPANAQGEMLVKTTLKNKEGNELGTFEKKEALSFWIQFFLIFIMPFNWPNTVITEMLYDLNRATIAQADGAGLLRAQHMAGWQWAQVTQ